MTAATLQADRGASWAAQLARYAERARAPRRLVVEGRLTRMVGLTIEAVGCQVAIGGRCLIAAPDGREIEAEVVGFAGERLFLMPVGDIGGLSPQCRVIPTQAASQAAVGEALLGRVVDASGRPLDGAGRLRLDAHAPLAGRHINPLARAPVDEPLDVGVRAVNALLTMGRGQRMGLFAGSGVGKSVLLGMMTRYTNADVVVVALIGERGREVGDFVHKTLGPTAMARSVVVASPADCPPLMRVHGAMLATTIAEHFRDRGYKVLLLMDSLTRYAQAQREIGLAIGEAPATKGYPPSAFARLPQLVERAGCADTTGAGSISAIYTVLTEGDDPDDPIADAARAILDGHIVLSRRLAEAGHYPAIDIEASVSRVMSDVAAPASVAAARRFKQIYSTYQQHRDLINVGAYQRGSDSRVDEAIERYPALERFLQQDMGNAVTLEDSATQLQALTGAKPQAGG